MSYAYASPVRALGIIAGSTPDCVGHIEKRYADGDVAYGECCPTEEWSVNTYRGVKGPDSWRRRAENQIRRALAAAVAPTSTGETYLERYAYELSRTVDILLAPNLIDRIQKAASRFDLIAPTSRWHQVQSMVPESMCRPDDGWDFFVPTNSMPYDAVRVQALVAAVGKPGPKLADVMAAQQRFYAYDQPMPSASGEYAAWQKRVKAIVEDVPVSGTMPIGLIDLQPISLVEIDGSVMRPTAWFTSLLDALVPDRYFHGPLLRPRAPTYHGPLLQRPGGGSGAASAGGATSGVAIAALSGIVLYGAYRWMRAR